MNKIPSFKAMLEAWSERMHLSMSPTELGKLVVLDDLVVQWGAAVGLIGFKSQRERFERYFVEALQALAALPERGMAVDVGSGGGTPALPLAIIGSGIRWVLLEPNGRKAIFLDEAARSLGLGNVEVRRDRYNVFTPDRAVDLVTTRGLTVSRELLSCAWRWVEPGGHLFSWTGERLKDEIAGRCGGFWRVKGKDALAPRYDTWLLRLERL